MTKENHLAKFFILKEGLVRVDFVDQTFLVGLADLLHLCIEKTSLEKFVVDQKIETKYPISEV